SIFLFPAVANTEPSTLSLHDALPISAQCQRARSHQSRESEDGRAATELSRRRHLVHAVRFLDVHQCGDPRGDLHTRGSSRAGVRDRKSTRLNSSHRTISYAVFCLKKK